MNFVLLFGLHGQEVEGFSGSEEDVFLWHIKLRRRYRVGDSESKDREKISPHLALSVY